MANVGEAVIRIIGDSSAFDRTINNLGSGSRGFLSNADRIGTKFGEGVGRATGRALKVGLLAAAGGVALAVGATLSKGFKRFTTIEDATKSLTLLLGDAAKAGQLLDQTLKVVEGTPFALEDFVDASRNLVANNVELAKVPRILTAIGDAAAASGGSAEDVNAVATSFGRMATGAQLTLGPIRELEDKGVPALRILANQAGKSAEDMAKDITAGSIDSRKAIDDLTEGILNGTKGINGATVAYGGAAKGVGNTVSGAFANMKTAIARAGANIIKVFADSGKGGSGLVKIINSVRDTIDVLGKAGVRLAERFATGGTMDKVLVFFEKLPKRVEDAVRSIEGEGSFGAAFDNLAGRIMDGIQRALEKAPTGQLSAIIVTLVSRGLEGLAAGSAAIVAAVIKNAPAIIKGIIEGLVKAATSNPLNMALFLGALGIPGVGAALAGFFRFLPFGSIIAPLITGLTTAMRAGVGAIFAPLLTAPAAAAPVQLALQGIGTSAATAAGSGGVGALGAAITTMASVAVPAAIGVGLAFLYGRDQAVLFEEEIDKAAERAKTGVVLNLEDTEFKRKMDNAGASLIKTTATAAVPKIDADKTQFDSKTKIVDKKLNELIAAEAHPKIKVEVENESALDRILGKLGRIVSRVWQGVVDIFTGHSGGLVTTRRKGGGYGVSGSFHSGGLVKHLPRLHSGTLNTIAGSFASGLKQDERVAVLQVGELVLSKKQVAQAKAGVDSTGHTFNIYEVGDGQATAERILNRLAVG